MFVCQSHTNPQLYHGFLMIISISIYQISGQQFSHVLIGSRNLEYPWIFTVLRTERKMACHLANVSKEEILAISETAFFYPSDLVNTKTTIPFRVGEEQWINIPRRFASRYISTTIHLPFGGQLYNSNWTEWSTIQGVIR